MICQHIEADPVLLRLAPERAIQRLRLQTVGKAFQKADFLSMRWQSGNLGGFYCSRDREAQFSFRPKPQEFPETGTDLWLFRNEPEDDYQ